MVVGIVEDGTPKLFRLGMNHKLDGTLQSSGWLLQVFKQLLHIVYRADILDSH